jgi:hypothetical protein
MRTLRGCWWWLGTIGVGLFIIGLVLVYPWLLIVTAATMAAVLILTYITSHKEG